MRKILVCIVCLLFVGFMQIRKEGIPKNLRQPIDSTRSIIGISVAQKNPAKKSKKTKQAEKVAFVKIRESDIGEANKMEIVISNYTRGARVFLINAEPGSYAAIASVYYKSYTKGKYKRKSAHTTLFSEETIKKSLIKVKPGELAFMGKFLIGELPDISKGDLIQKRNHEMFLNSKAKYAPDAQVYFKRGVLKEHEPLNMASFLRIKSDFKGTGWNDMIRKRWQEVLDKREKDTDTDGSKTK